MSFDWQSYLNQQIAASQPQEVSYFPQSPWSSLAQIMHIVGTSMAVPKAKAQYQFQQGEERAKQFGTPGLRQFYASPQAQEWARISGRTIPAMPALSPDEIEAQRIQQFYELRQKQIQDLTARTMAGAPAAPGAGIGVEGLAGRPQAFGQVPAQEGRQPTAAEIQAATAPSLAQYPDIAQLEGFVPKPGSAVDTAMIRLMAGGNTNPQAVYGAAVYDWTVVRGMPLDQMPDTYKQAIQQITNPLYEAKVQETYNRAAQAAASAGLSEQKTRDLQATLQTRMEKTMAEVHRLESLGKFEDANRLYVEEKTKWDEMLKPEQLVKLTTEVDKNIALTGLIHERVELTKTEEGLNQARAKYYASGGAHAAGTNPQKLKLQEITGYSSYIQKAIKGYQDALPFITDPAKKSAAEGRLETLREEQTKIQNEWLNIMEGKPDPNLTRGSDQLPNVNVPNVSAIGQGMVDATVAHLTSADPKSLQSNFQNLKEYAASHPNDARFKGATAEDWQAVWSAWLMWAHKHGLKGDLPMPGADSTAR
jgi:hypothetical protein